MLLSYAIIRLTMLTVKIKQSIITICILYLYKQMSLIEHKCYTATCNKCNKEFQTEINGIDNYYFLSKIELEEAFYDEDWKVIDNQYICNKCIDTTNSV